jgi:RimJ/RimL family protein N-acetyltransferase
MTLALETKRLVLRAPAAADAEAIVRYLNNFAVAGNLSHVPYPYCRTDADWWLSRQRPDAPPAETQFAIELTGVGYIGQVGFHAEDIGPAIGYWLGQPFWHRGIMTEAAGAALDWYFWASDALLIHSGVFAFNRASLAVQKKLGFTVTGSSTRHCLARREELRHIDTELSRANWTAYAARLQSSSNSPAERAKDSR